MEPKEFLATTFGEREARFSPDGRYLAYTSDETDRYEVWVRRFPDDGGKWQISTDGGGQPSWSADGKELFYVASGTLMAVSVSLEDGFARGQAQPLFTHSSFGMMTNPRQTYVAAIDGERFLVLETPADSMKPALRIVQNWYEEFRDRY